MNQIVEKEDRLFEAWPSRQEAFVWDGRMGPSKHHSLAAASPMSEVVCRYGDKVASHIPVHSARTPPSSGIARPDCVSSTGIWNDR